MRIPILVDAQQELHALASSAIGKADEIAVMAVARFLP